jgi:SAM-dependent methyltransferase
MFQLVSDESDAVLPVSTEVRCPVCDNACVSPPLYRYTVRQAAAHFCPPTRSIVRNQSLQDCIDRLWQGKDCFVLQCDHCGFGFGYPFVGGDENFYDVLLAEKSYPRWRWDYDVAVSEAMGKYSGGKVLDIGAGLGVFLRRLGSNWEKHAVEGSEITRGELEESGIKVFRDLSEVARTDAGTFQVITLFQVLEHIADFDSILKHCYELLAIGGRLVITVPDGEAMIRQESMTGCPDMPPNHISKWTPGSLGRVLTRIGFECGAPMLEPYSLKNFRANLHMRVATDATEEGTLAGKVYRITNHKMRIALLSALALPALLRMLPYGRRLMAGGAFAIVAVR